MLRRFRSVLGAVGLVASLTALLPCGPEAESPRPAPVAGGEEAAPAPVEAGAPSDTGAAPAPEPEPEPVAVDQPLRHELYASLSPISPVEVEAMQAVAARSSRRRDDVFAKLGGSSVESHAFLHCFRGRAVDLGGHADLEESLQFFRRGNAGGRSPFTRESLAARVGWSIRHGMAGRPPRVHQEIQAISPRYALVFFGGNDVQARNERRFTERLERLVDFIVARGVIPVVGATLPRNDDPVMDQWARRYNRMSRAIAMTRGLPYVDFNAALQGLPARGLAGDGVHANIYRHQGRGRGCFLTDEGLRRGQNVRNLLTLQTLDRLRRTLSAEEPAPDAAGPARRGVGTPGDPIRVERSPFHARLRPQELSATVDHYGCEEHSEALGSEAFFRVVLDGPTQLRVSAVGDRHHGPRVYQLGADGAPASCVRESHRDLVVNLEAGVHHFAVELGEGDDRDVLFVLDVEP